MKKHSRRDFISATGTLATGLFILLSSFFSFPNKDTKRYLNGRLYDLFGYPVSGATAELVRNYKLDLEYMNISEPVTVASAITDSNGLFFLKFDTANRPDNIGVIFKINGVVQPINSFGLTNTNIPFPIQEIYSSDEDKWLTDMLPVYISAGANFYIDTSRQMIKNYIGKTGLAKKLISFDEIETTSSHTVIDNSYYGNHQDPDNPDKCIEEGSVSPGDCISRCRHWGSPEIIDKNRKVIIPWGKSGRSVIPFVVSEGRLYSVEAQTGDDYDRIFKTITNPAYKHISNPVNANYYCNQGSIEGEMCIWFMGTRNADGSFSKSFTNIERTDNTARLVSMFNIPTNDKCQAYVYDKKGVYVEDTRGHSNYEGDTCSKLPVRKESDCKTTRTWMLGTWCSDSCHETGNWLDSGDHFNEIHPVYWIVPFFGSWERFHLSQYHVMTDLIIQPQYFEKFKVDALLRNLREFVIALIGNSKNNYSKYVVHLHQYGLDLLEPEEKKAGIDTLSSIKMDTIDFWAQHQPISVLSDILKRKLQKVFDLLTNAGSGFLLYPAMFYCYEMAELKKIKNKYALEADLTNDVRKYVREALFKMNSYENLLSLKGAMQTSYEFCLEGLYSKIPGNKNAIAEFYAQSALRYLSQGLQLDILSDNTLSTADNSTEYTIHFNYALKILDAGNIQPLVALMKKRVSNFWKDAIPFARSI